MISIRNTSLNMFEYAISIIAEQWFQLSANNVWVNPQVLFPTNYSKNWSFQSQFIITYSEIYTVPSATTTTTTATISFEIRTCQQTCQANCRCLTGKEVGFGAKQLSLDIKTVRQLDWEHLCKILNVYISWAAWSVPWTDKKQAKNTWLCWDMIIYGLWVYGITHPWDFYIDKHMDVGQNGRPRGPQMLV